jgi:sensor histidine kinase YesM
MTGQPFPSVLSRQTSPTRFLGAATAFRARFTAFVARIAPLLSKCSSIWPEGARAMTIQQRYRQRVGDGLRWRAFATVALLALLVSTQLLFQPHLFEMWEPRDVALGWAEYLGQVAAIGAVLLVAVVAVEESPVTGGIARTLLLAAALVLPVLVLSGLFAWRYSGNWLPASPWQLLGESLKFSLLGAFAYGVRLLQRNAERANAEALALDESQRELERQAEESQLQLLQAQIEPHFLFNTLANVRRLYRRQPAAGAEAIDNLMVYLRAALPQVRRSESTLGDEFELAQAYLQLFRVRMGSRLRFVLDLPPELRQVPFPPMVLLTLAENAIKHGLAPADSGGTVRIMARVVDGTRLEISVADDGVGFGPSTSGSGVGLVNIRRQLAARYGDGARLTLEQATDGGVCARVTLPCHSGVARGVAPPLAAAVRA